VYVTEADVLDTTNEPVTPSEPDITTFWFNVLKPVAFDAVIAYDADAADDAVPNNDAVTLPNVIEFNAGLYVIVLVYNRSAANGLLFESTNVGKKLALVIFLSDIIVDAVCAVVIKDAVMAFCAQDAVPNNDPVIPAVTLSEPVMLELPCEKYPFFIMNSFAIPFPYPSYGFIIYI